MEDSSLSPRQWSDLRISLKSGQPTKFKPENKEDKARWLYVGLLNALYVGDLHTYRKLDVEAGKMGHDILFHLAKQLSLNSSTEKIQHVRDSDLESLAKKDDSFWLFEVYFHLGVNHIRLGNYDKGETYLKELMETSMELNNPYMTLMAIFRLTYLYESTHNLFALKNILKIAQDTIEVSGYNYFWFNLFWTKANLSRALGQYKESFEEFGLALAKGKSEASIETHYALIDQASVAKWLGYGKAHSELRDECRKRLSLAGRKPNAIDVNYFLLREIEDCLCCFQLEDIQHLLSRLDIATEFFEPYEVNFSNWFCVLNPSSTEEQLKKVFDHPPRGPERMERQAKFVQRVCQIRLGLPVLISEDLEALCLNESNPQFKVILRWVKLMEAWAGGTYEEKVDEVNTTLKLLRFHQFSELEFIYLRLLEQMGAAGKKDSKRTKVLIKGDYPPQYQLNQCWPFSEIGGAVKKLRLTAGGLIVNESARVKLPKSKMQRVLLQCLLQKPEGHDFTSLTSLIWNESYCGEYHREKLRRLASATRKYLESVCINGDLLQSVTGVGYKLNFDGSRPNSENDKKLMEFLNNCGTGDRFTPAELGLYLGCEKRQAQAHIKILSEKGLIEVANTGNPRKYRKVS